MPSVTARSPLTAFCEREYPRLVGTLRLVLRDPDAAEELAQETLLVVCQHWQHVATLESPRAWAHRVALNKARSWVRRRIAERRAYALLEGECRQHVPDSAEALALRGAVASLPRRQRTALVLRYYADLPARDVAAVMGCRESTVRVLTHHAIASLRANGALINEEEG